MQYFIGVQLDGSEYLEPERRRLSEKTEKEGAKVVQETANNIDDAVRELPDANLVRFSHHSQQNLGPCLLFYPVSIVSRLLTCLYWLHELETGGFMVQAFTASAPETAQ